MKKTKSSKLKITPPTKGRRSTPPSKAERPSKRPDPANAAPQKPQASRTVTAPSDEPARTARPYRAAMTMRDLARYFSEGPPPPADDSTEEAEDARPQRDPRDAEGADEPESVPRPPRSRSSSRGNAVSLARKDLRPLPTRGVDERAELRTASSNKLPAQPRRPSADRIALAGKPIARLSARVDGTSSKADGATRIEATTVPHLLVPVAQIMKLRLDHRAGFLLANIDGRTNVQMLVDLASLSRSEVERILRELMTLGVVAVASRV